MENNANALDEVFEYNPAYPLPRIGEAIEIGLQLFAVESITHSYDSNINNRPYLLIRILMKRVAKQPA